MRILRESLVACTLLLAAAGMAQAQTTGSISGAVTGPTGSPVQNIWIYAHAASTGGYYSAAQTDVTGTFTLPALAPDTYYLSTETSTSFAYVPQYYGTTCPTWRCTFRDGTPIALAAGLAVTGIQFNLRTGGSVAGHLFDATTSGPVPPSTDATARLYDELGYQVATDSIYSSSNGYQFDRLPAGRYHLLIQTYTYQAYISELGDGRHCPFGCAITAGTPFEVTDGGAHILNVVLDRLGRITGRLLNEATGQAIAAANVKVQSLDGHFSASGYPQSPSFEYEVLVPPGKYTVLGLPYFDLVPEFYGGLHAACDVQSYPTDDCAGLRRLATVVEVAAGTTRSGIDIRLDTGGSISGALTVAGPLSSGVSIKVLTRGGVVVRNTPVLAPGTFQLQHLPPGVYHVCASSPGNFRTQAFGGPEFFEPDCPPSAGAPVTVTAGVSTPSIDFTLQPLRASGSTSATISGAARDATGQPLRGLIRVYSEGDFNDNIGSIASDGTYSISVGGGTFFVRTEAYDNFVDEWYGGVCVVCGDARGTPVVVTPGTNATNINFALAPGGSIQGTISPTSAPIGVYDVTGRPIRPPVWYSNSYSIRGLPAGTYYLRTHAQSDLFIDAIHPNIPCMSSGCPVQAGAPVVVAAGQTTAGVDITMLQGGVIGGRATLRGAVVDADGGLVRPTVEAFDATGRPAGRFASASNATYEIRGLMSGTYYLRTTDAPKYGAVNQAWQAIECAGCPVTDATPVQVVQGQTTARIDFELDAGGAISGLVVESGSGAPLDNQRVEVRTASGELAGSALTTLDGSYLVGGLADGSFLVQTVTKTGHLDQRYHGVACVKCSLDDGMPVVVASRGTVAGINFALVRGGRVAGRVTTAGVALGNVTVTVVDATGVVLGRSVSSASGGFTVSAPAGVAYAKTEPTPRYITQAFDRQTCPGGNCNLTAATALSVQLGQARSGVDFPLTACTPATVLPASLPPSVVSHAYSALFVNAGGTAPFRYAPIGGDLPPGLSLAETTGMLTGTLTRPGTYRFTIGAVDALGCGAQQTYQIEVKGCGVTLSTEQLAYPSAGGQSTVGVVGGCSSWRASTQDPWITVTQASGSVAIAAASNSGATRYGRVTIGGRSVFISQASLVSGLPFGSLDVPLEGVTVRGSIAVGGWALDDVQVTRVVISRDAVAPEPAGQLIYIGDAVRVRGARPDVEALFPTYPEKDKAGWGFLLLTNMLPGQGNGVFRLHAHAIDFEGNQRLLGSRSIVAANATATLPFGAIDTPGQGETISGSAFVNFGWALTPLSKTIPSNGSTITVIVDGVAVGTVDYGHFRSDVATLFPGLNNSAGAVGFRRLNTTQLANGIHTISWVVSDDSGATEGIGSRYFHVNNTTAPVSGLQSDPVATETVEASAASIVPRGDARRVVRIREMERLTLDLGPAIKTVSECRSSFAGYEVVGDERRPLPAGSTLDPSTGAFAWQPGPGFIGTYQLIFTASGCAGGEIVAPIEVRIVRSSR